MALPWHCLEPLPTGLGSRGSPAATSPGKKVQTLPNWRSSLPAVRVPVRESEGGHPILWRSPFHL